MTASYQARIVLNMKHEMGKNIKLGLSPNNQEENMNNVFLYAAKDSKSYRQVEEYLVNLSFDEKIIILPPGSQFSSPLCLHLRSNDVIVLYIEDREAIDE